MEESSIIRMSRLRITLVLLVLTYTISIGMPHSEALAPRSWELRPSLPTNAVPKVQIDSEGAIHLLWTIPSLRSSAPGVWYSKYEANGTNSIPPMLIRNSSLVQSADMAVDKFGNPHIAWAEGSAFADVSLNPRPDLESRLYYVEINSTITGELTPTAVAGAGRFVMWPSVAVDEHLTTHLVWIQVDLTEKTNTGAYYGIIDRDAINRTTFIAAFDQSFASIPRPRIALDEASYDLHVVWVRTDELPSGEVVSSVNYARINLARRNVTYLEVAKTEEHVEDASVTAGPAGNAYVVWEPEDVSRPSGVVYVNQISREGNIVFSKQLNQPNPDPSTHPYLSLSTDSQDNLYVIWYQPPAPPRAEAPPTTSAPTSISYLKLDRDGSVSQTGNEVINGPVIAFRVSQSGDLYAISQGRIVAVTKPTIAPYIQIMSAGLVALAVLTSVAATEDGRYRLMRPMTRFAKRLSTKRADEEARILKLVSRRPGIRLTEINSQLPEVKYTMFRLLILESKGYVSSVRAGLSRRFYGSIQTEFPEISHSGASQSIPARILDEIARNPGIWEGGLAQILDLSQQIVHYHLKRLHAAKIIRAELRERRKHYTLSSHET